MIIKKIHKTKLHTVITLDDEVIKIPLNFSFDFFLYPGKELSKSETITLFKYAKYSEVLKYSYSLLKRYRYSVFSFKRKISEKFDQLPDDFLKELVNNLIKEGYLNDKIYAQDLIESLKTKSYSQERIKKTLIEKGIFSFSEYFLETDFDYEIEAINRALLNYERKYQPYNDTSQTKRKTYEALVKQGYRSDLVLKAIKEHSFQGSLSSFDVCLKDAMKVKRKYVNKVKEEELYSIITSKLYNLNYSKETIENVMEEIKNEN